MLAQWKSLAALALLLSSPAFAADEPGVTATEIKIGGVFGLVGKGLIAYIQSVNDRGGINGREINYIAYDDAYSPPKAVWSTSASSSRAMKWRSCSASSARPAFQPQQNT